MSKKVCLKCGKEIDKWYVLNENSEQYFTVSTATFLTSISSNISYAFLSHTPASTSLPPFEPDKKFSIFPLNLDLCKECLLKALSDIIVAEAL